MESRNCFKKGFCRAYSLNVADQKKFNITTQYQNECNAIAKDWENVGKDITETIKKYGAKNYRY